MPKNNIVNHAHCRHLDAMRVSGMEHAFITGEFFSKNTPLESVIRGSV